MRSLSLPAGTKVPNHVVYIPDGDRRWARARGLSASEGHRAGFENTLKLLKATRSWGIHTVTGWGLSTENWLERPQEEVDFLIRGMVMYIKKYLDEAMKEGVRIIHLGRRDRLPRALLDALVDAEQVTRNNNKHVYNLALDYNGPDEIMRAIKKMLVAGVKPDEVDRKLVNSYMDTAGQLYPYPDLIIRTSGEQRTSGILLWQSDYAEMYWEADHFPDFTPERLRDAILDYSRRRRRFGGNDAEEHLKFDPKVVAGLEIRWRHALLNKQDERLRDLVIKYVKEHYGISKELAKEAGVNLAKALIHGREENWEEAEKSFGKLYGVIKGALGFTFEPHVVARIEVQLGRDGNEENLRSLIAEKFRFSKFQAAKSAHLAYLANVEMAKDNWDKAKGLMEKFYVALKERVA